jgi:quinol-cytochrome oxidoreductase complex cytochrome b subunit
MRGIAAGMSGEEVRAIARGESPTERPNPRYLAHTLSFLLHLRPRTYPQAATRFSHTFRLGFFAVFLFVVEIITGFILMIYYSPTPATAYESLLQLMNEVPFGKLLRDVHRLAGEAMIVVVALHMLRTFLTGSYKKKRKSTWVTGVALLLITLGLGFSGYLLPWDQLAYWAVTIGTSMAEATPLIGPELNLLLRGAPEIGGDGLLRFYLLHVIVLPLAAILVMGAHYYRVSRHHGISLPAAVEEGDLSPEARRKATQKINFIPDILTHELLLTMLGLLALLAAVAFFYSAPLEHHANPRQTPLDTEAPWFFLWVQGLLKLGDKTLMGVIIPTLITVALFAVPYLDTNPLRSPGKRPLAIVLALVSVASLVVLSYMGTHRYGIDTPAAVRIMQNLAPEEGSGPLHQVPFEQLAVGIYPINETDSASLPPALAEVFNQFKQHVNQATAQGDLPEAQGVMIVEAWQANLQRVTLRITWTDPLDAQPRSQERQVYLHRDRLNHITR